MCNNQKMLKQQLKNNKKAKYEMGNFCEQFGLTPIAPGKKGKRNMIKSIEIINKKKKKQRCTKPNDFYAKKKNVLKKKDKQKSGKGKCFNRGKYGHYSKKCKQKLGKLKKQI